MFIVSHVPASLCLVTNTQIFNDPTITKEEQKDLLTSQFQRDFVYSQHVREETNRGPLFPEYAIHRSLESQWAECALANGVKVFQSKKLI